MNDVVRLTVVATGSGSFGIDSSASQACCPQTGMVLQSAADKLYMLFLMVLSWSYACKVQPGWSQISNTSFVFLLFKIIRSV
jgi:hypothetical protein